MSTFQSNEATDLARNQDQSEPFGVTQKADLFDELSTKARNLGYGNLLSAISSLEIAEQLKPQAGKRSSA